MSGGALKGRFACFSAASPFLLLLVLLAIMGVSLAGCSALAPGTQHASAGHSGSREFILGGLAGVSSLNPLYPANPEGEALGRLVFGSLFTLGPRGELVPDLATGYSVSPGGLAITVTLRRGVHWQNGSVFGPQDVVATFRAVANPANHSPFWGVTRDLASVSVLGGRRVVFQLAGSDVFFPQDALAQIPIVSSTVLGGSGRDSSAPNLQEATFGLNSLGAGPYLFRRRRGNAWFFEANPGYFAGKPAIPKLEYRTYPDAKDLAAAVADGEVSFAAGSLPAVHGATKKVTFVQPAVVAMLFNDRQALLRDPRVRRAISLAIDRRQLVQGVLGGRGVPGVTVFPPLPGGGTPGGQANFHPGRAKALLAAAGWVSTGGVWTKGGRMLTLDLLVPTGDPALEETGAALAGQLENMGVNVQLEQMKWGDLLRRAVAGKFAGVLMSLQLTPGLDPEGLLASWAVPPNGNNLGYYRNNEADAQLAAVKAGTSGARTRLQRILLQDPPGAFLYYPEETVATVQGLTGYVPDPYVLYNGVASWRLR